MEKEGKDLKVEKEGEEGQGGTLRPTHCGGAGEQADVREVVKENCWKCSFVQHTNLLNIIFFSLQHNSFSTFSFVQHTNLPNMKFFSLQHQSFSNIQFCSTSCDFPTKSATLEMEVKGFATQERNALKRL